MRLRARAPAKVNLSLFVGGPRDDGRHQLVTLFESVSLADEVVLSTRVGLGDEVICPGVEGPNIVARALQGLRERGWQAPHVRVEIDKRIPVAAGMGGGSADAAATLRIAERLADVPADVIDKLAAELGSDVPSQLQPGLVIGTGAGDVVRRVWSGAPLAPHAYLVLPAASGLSTADVYAQADRLGGLRDEADLAALDRELGAAVRLGGVLSPSLLVNDLQPASLALCPEIAAALDAAREGGAEHAFVCGSGATVAGLYWGADAEQRAALAAAWLADRYPGACAATPVARDFGFPVFA